MDLSYIINELGEERAHYFDAVTPPIMQTAIFASKDVASMRENIVNEAQMPFYTRGTNPTTQILQKKMAALEKAEDALIFASGMAAVSAAILANVSAGQQIISVQKPYSWINVLFNQFLPRFDIRTRMIDGANPQNFKDAIRSNTKIIFLESPNSWTFEQQDIEEVVKLAKEYNILTIIDNSYATPLAQNPIEMGVDMVVHSASKYLGGHCDVIAGVVCSHQAMIQKIFTSSFMTFGGIIAPFNAWLLLRGLRTLPIRLEKISQTSPKIIAFLENHPKVAKVYAPFSASYPQTELTKKQMRQALGLFSVILKAQNRQEVENFCNSLQRFLMTASWGGYQSLVFPACALYDAREYEEQELPWNMLRFYIGLEDANVLIEDLAQAFEHIT